MLFVTTGLARQRGAPPTEGRPSLGFLAGEHQRRRTWHAFTTTLGTQGGRGYRDGPGCGGES